MSIVCSLFRAPDSTLTVLQKQPEYFQDFEMLQDKPMKFAVKPSLIGRLFGRKPREVQLGHDEVPFARITEADLHYLNKAWHVLHYLMTGTAEEVAAPLGFLLTGGSTIGEQLPGYDAVPRAFFSGETKKIAAEVQRLQLETMAARFDWPEMMRQQVYPEIRIAEKFPAQLWSDYSGHFGHLKEFLQTAAAANQGFVIRYG